MSSDELPQATKVLLAPFLVLRWLDIKLGGRTAKCKWDGHDVSEPHDHALYSVKRCDRCERLVRVK